MTETPSYHVEVAPITYDGPAYYAIYNHSGILVAMIPADRQHRPILGPYSSTTEGATMSYLLGRQYRRANALFIRTVSRATMSYLLGRQYRLTHSIPPSRLTRALFPSLTRKGKPRHAPVRDTSIFAYLIPGTVDRTTPIKLSYPVTVPRRMPRVEQRRRMHARHQRRARQGMPTLLHQKRGF